VVEVVVTGVKLVLVEALVAVLEEMILGILVLELELQVKDMLEVILVQVVVAQVVVAEVALLL
jgi:hypothetical protein